MRKLVFLFILASIMGVNYIVIFLLTFLLSSEPAWADLDLAGSYLLDLYSVEATNMDSRSMTVGSLLASGDYSLSEENSFYVSINLIHASGSPSTVLGDLQIASNIDAEVGD